MIDRNTAFDITYYFLHGRNASSMVTTCKTSLKRLHDASSLYCFMRGNYHNIDLSKYRKYKYLMSWSGLWYRYYDFEKVPNIIAI